MIMTFKALFAFALLAGTTLAQDAVYKNDFQSAKAVIFYNFHQAENRKIFKLKKELKKVGGH